MIDQSPTNENVPTALAEIHDGLIDEQTLRDLVRDLTQCAKIKHVQIKNDARGSTTEINYDLDQAVQHLITGSARAVQIRYTYNGSQWSDTLMRIQNGFRIVRINVDQLPDHE